MSPADDSIDRLIAELHDSIETTPSDGSDTARLDRWLRLVVRAGGSDLLLVPGTPPSMRVDGRLRPLPDGPIDGLEVEEAVLPALAPHARQLYRRDGIADGSHRVDGLGRFRINLHHERGHAAAAVRALPTRVPRLAS